MKTGTPALVLLMAGLAGCGMNPPAQSLPAEILATTKATTVQTPTTQGADEMKRPFMIGEAKLPEGFPPPSAVGEVVAKDYPAARAAIVKSKAGDNGMFRSLFNHIKRNDIAMSAPVEMDYDGDPSTSPMVSMAFFYRQREQGKLGPDQEVTVVDLPAMKVLSVAFRGSYSTSTYAKGAEQLRQWLKEHSGQYEVQGTIRVLGYNSPFVPWFLKYGEVQLPITPATAP